MLTTHQESVVADLTARQDQMLATAIPNADEKSDQVQEQLAELQARAEAEREEKISACRKVEALLLTQSRIATELEHLKYLAGVAESSAVNARAAAEQYLISQTAGEAYAIQNYKTLTNEMLRAAAVAPVIPALISERADAIKASQTEVAALVKRYGIDVPALLEFLRKQRGVRPDIVYVAPLN